MDADSLNLIGVDDFRGNPNFAQFDGSGPTANKYSIAIIGTGAQLNHPAFGADLVAPIGIADRIVYQENFAQPGMPANETDTGNPDTSGKGTGAAHVIADMAPGVNLIILKAFDAGDSSMVSTPRIVDALEWVRMNAEDFNIVAVHLAFTRVQPLYQEVADPSIQEDWVGSNRPKARAIAAT